MVHGGIRHHLIGFAHRHASLLATLTAKSVAMAQEVNGVSSEFALPPDAPSFGGRRANHARWHGIKFTAPFTLRAKSHDGDRMAASSTQTKEQLKAENDYLRKGGLALQVAETIRTGMWCCLGIVACYFAADIIRSLAGKQTDANIFVRFVSELNISIAIAWAAGAGGMYYGHKQKKLRQSATERYCSRIADLERLIDKGRSSSRIASNGETNPEDLK